MDLRILSDSEIINRIEILRGKEREVVLKFLLHLGELDVRRSYLSLGYSSLFDYCVRKLKYSEGATFRRIESARILRMYPELADKFLSGEVSVSTVAAASTAIKSNKIKISEIIGKSTREVESLVALEVKTIKPIERIREVKVTKEAIFVGETKNITDTNLPLLSMPKEENSLSLPAPKVEITEESRFEIKFSLSKEAYQKLQEATARLSNKLGANLSVEGVVTELLNQFTEDSKPRERTVVNTDTRYIPAAVKWEVRKRDNCQCTFVSKDGVRCSEKRYLHFDHVEPFALGGKSTTENLRLLCAAHNLERARDTFHNQRDSIPEAMFFA